MKLVKTQICLYIYEQLLFHKHIDIHLTKQKFNLNDKTFSRYISEIKKYLKNFNPNKEIVWIRENKEYRLVELEK